MSCQPQATHHYLESLRTKLSLQERSRSARNQRLPTRLGRIDQGREGVAGLLERRHAGHLGTFPDLQPVARQCPCPGWLLARLHAALADQFVKPGSNVFIGAGAAGQRRSQNARAPSADSGCSERQPTVSRIGFVQPDWPNRLRCSCPRCRPTVRLSKVRCNPRRARTRRFGRRNLPMRWLDAEERPRTLLAPISFAGVSPTTFRPGIDPLASRLHHRWQCLLPSPARAP
jgi:hypothetical protein